MTEARERRLLKAALLLLLAWRQHFDHLLLIDAAGQPEPGDGLELLPNQGFARLYRIPR